MTCRGSPPSSQQGTGGVHAYTCPVLQPQRTVPRTTPLSVPTWCCRARRGAKPPHRPGLASPDRTRAAPVSNIINFLPSSRFPSSARNWSSTPPNASIHSPVKPRQRANVHKPPPPRSDHLDRLLTVRLLRGWLEKRSGGKVLGRRFLAWKGAARWYKASPGDKMQGGLD